MYQILKRHYARYTPEMVERVCGVPAEQFLDDRARRGRRTPAASAPRRWCTASGWTQHSVGAQYIRAGAIIQLLLGNIGRPGGGVFALRGHASIQGSTDVPTLFNLLPGYLAMPQRGRRDAVRLPRRASSATNQKGFWHNADTYMVSLLKEYWGENATAENDYCFDYLPRINGDHGTYRTVMDMVDGKVFGYFLLGQNPAVGSAHGRLQRLGMANLDWLVVRDLVEIESATFWKDGPEVETGEITPETCRTEVFLFPAASHVEKAGTFTQTQRMLQWREKAVEPPGDARSELWFFYHLGRILREKLAGSTDERDRPLLDLSWDYAMEGDEPSAEDVLRRISGVDLTTGRAVDNYLSLKADGSTMCGCWIYSGVYADEVNQAARRKPHDEQVGRASADSQWGWTWPMNRRVLYNRASADPQGRPWSERKKLVWWDADKGEWTGHDVPDFEKTKPPDYRPPEGAVGVEALRGDDPFIMQADGKGWLFAPERCARRSAADALRAARVAGAQRVVQAAGQPGAQSVWAGGQSVEPVAAGGAWRGVPVRVHRGAADRAPHGGRDEPAAAVSVGAAAGVVRGGVAGAGGANADWRIWSGRMSITSRTAVDARVFVTDRMRPLRIEDHVVHQIWMPYHWGDNGLVDGDVVNDLLGVVADPNVFIQESKVATCDIQPGRRPRGPALLEYIASYRRTRGHHGGDGNALGHDRAIRGAHERRSHERQQLLRAAGGSGG